MNKTIREICSLLIKLKNYGDVYQSTIGKGTSNLDPNCIKILKTDIPNLLKGFFSDDHYLIEGSVGKGRVALTPWIAILDSRVTKSTQQGVYLVILFSKDLKKVYFSLAQGVTDSTTDEITAMRESIRNSLPVKSEYLKCVNDIGIENKDYKNSVIYSNEWNLKDISFDERLLFELKNAYQKYVSYFCNRKNLKPMKMPKEDETILRYMSERLKQGPYISNPNAKAFIAEIATIILHILQKDRKFDLQIDDCFNDLKGHVFDYSLKKIESSRDLAFFQNKDDNEFNKVFLDMVDIYFNKEDICTLVQSFDEIDTIDNDYQIIFKKKDNDANIIIPEQEKKEEVFIINRLTSESEIIQYFNNKIKEGYYTDIYKLLVDLTLMMYRQGDFSINLSLPAFNSTITYINSLIKKYWIHSLPANELEAKFSYLWKKTKQTIVNRAISALQIPYRTNSDGSFVLTQENKEPVVNEDVIEPQNVNEDHTEDIQIDSNPDDTIESKLSELFNISETAIIEEDALLNEINSLLYSRAWDNVYDLFGDIQYIIFAQKKIAELVGKTIHYNNVPLCQFEGRQNYFLRTFPKRIKLDSRQILRNRFRVIWHDNYATSTVIKIGLKFEPIKSIDKLGNIKLNSLQIEDNNTAVTDNLTNNSFLIEKEPEPEMVLSETNQINKLLADLYRESENFIIKEQKIIDLHSQLVKSKEWINISPCIASIAYVLIRQIDFANSPRSLNYNKLRYLFLKCIVIHDQDNLIFLDDNHFYNIKIVEERLIQRYGINLLIDFFKKIIGPYDVTADGTIIFEIESASEEATDPDAEKASDKNTNNIDEEIEEDDDDEPEVQEEYDEKKIEQDEEDVEPYINDSPVKIKFEYKTRAERELAEFWYSMFPNGYYDTYIWKNKISTETYGELKEKLKICVNDKQKEKGFTKRFAKAIVVYCAEWYKREYNGNDGKGNPLDAIGIKQLRSLDLWEWAEIDKKLLFGNEYLESIYTLGGFPIFYITSKKVDDILKELNSTYNDNTSNDSAKKRIFDKNKTLQYSLRKENGSLHLLFDYIKDPEHYPIADTDFDKDPFKKFIEGIQNFREKWDKFSLDWIVECNEYAPLIRRKIRLKLNPEENGIHNNRIPYYRVEKFKEEKDIDIYLCFNDEDTEDLENREHIHFINTFNGYFVGESVIDYYIFSEIPTIDINQIRVVAKHVDNEKSSNHDFVEIQVEQNIKPYLQLFETGKYSTYSTKRNQGDSYLLLPFNYPIVKGAINQDTSPKYLTENGIKYRFTKIIDQLIITDFDGKVIPVYSQNNKIEVSIEKYSDIFVYQNGNNFTRVVTDESGEETSSPVQLLFKKSDIKCTQYFDVTEPRDLEDDEVIIKFKKENDTFYSDWTENNQPEKGFIKLRVDVQDKKIHLDVYYIPSNEIPFKRDCIRNKIVIDNSVNIVESTSDDLKSCRDKYECLFKVGSTNDYVIIPIVKPLNITELYKDGEFIKEYKNESEQHISIPLLFKDKYSIRRYDESGMAYHELANEDIDILDFKFEDDCSSIEKAIERSTSVGNIEFYLCTTKKYIETSEGYKLNVGEIGADNYIFYFWDMNLNHEPNRINGTYEDGLLNLHSKDYPDGIIFQSLEGGICPRHYCMPILTTKSQKWPKDFNSLPVCLKCFDLASKHNIPYRVFEPLYWLLKDTDSRLIHFFASLILRHWDDKNDELLLSNLVRLSHELYFSWPFLNIKVWKQYKDEYMKLRNDKEERISSIKKEIFEDKFLKEAKRLFLIYAEITNQSSFLSMEKFANIYWNVNEMSLSQFISSYDYKWFTYDKIFDSSKGKKKIKWNSLASKALILMRARPINNEVKYPRNDGRDGVSKYKPDIEGFTDHENYDKRNRVDNIRDIGKICSFLKLLYEDDNSYSNIIRFFTYYGIIK